MNTTECRYCGLLIEPVIVDISGIGDDEENWQLLSEPEDMCLCDTDLPSTD
jgi:hypothetical protein